MSTWGRRFCRAFSIKLAIFQRNRRIPRTDLRFLPASSSNHNYKDGNENTEISLRSRRLEVVGTRKNGRARRRHASACLPRARPFSLSPTTSKRLLRRLHWDLWAQQILWTWTTHFKWCICFQFLCRHIVRLKDDKFDWNGNALIGFRSLTP